jgi:hypothetical protein
MRPSIRTTVLGLLYALVAGALLSVGRVRMAWAETASPAPSASASPAPSPAAESGPLITGIQGAPALWFLLGLVLLIVLAWLLPLMIDLLAAYRAQRRERDLLHELIKLVFARAETSQAPPPAGAQGPAAEVQVTATVSEAKLLDLLSAVGQPPTGTRGLNRVLMAFAIVTVIGVLSVALLFSGATDAAELRKTIVVGLIGVLATIVGFYFGSRTASEAQAKGPTGPQPPPRGAIREVPAGGPTEEHPPGGPPPVHPPGAPPPGAPPPGAPPPGAPPPAVPPPAPPPGAPPPGAPAPGGPPPAPPPDH